MGVDVSRRSTSEQHQGLGLPWALGKAGKWCIRDFQLVRLMTNASKSSSTDLGPNAIKREAQDPYPLGHAYQRRR